MVVDSELFAELVDDPEQEERFRQAFNGEMPVTVRALMHATAKGIHIRVLGEHLVWRFRQNKMEELRRRTGNADSKFGQAANEATVQYAVDGDLKEKDNALNKAKDILYNEISEVIVYLLKSAETANST